MNTLHRNRVVVVGASFAGLAACRRLPRDWNVTVLDKSPWFEFLPNIHELLSGVKTPELLRLPLASLVTRAGHRFLQDAVTGIDTAGRTVRTTAGEAIGYDALIVATGGANATHGVPGAEQHTLPFKSVDQCVRIGRRLHELVRRGRHAEVVIVGGGLEGIEALGEILRRYRACSFLRIHVVEAQERLLADAPAVLDGTLRQLCSPYDVVWHTAARVSCVDADAVTLSSGERLRSDATIWTGGPAGAALLAESGLAPRTGSWAPVTETLQSTVCPEIFVAGDACDLPTPISKQAYHALDSGACAGGNVVRLLRGQPLRAFAPAAKPMLIAFGDLSCFLVYGRMVLAGAALAAVKESVFHLVMAQCDQAGLAEAVPRGVLRIAQAVRMLLWPTISSLEALLRQPRITVLC